MSQPRPNPDQISAAIGAAERAVLFARETRKGLRRRRTARRAQRLSTARERCAAAARPLRSFIGMAAWDGIHIDDELAMKKVMEKLRYERRQIDKMLKR